jgi:flagella basal body P-ring formation protein FlgA
MRHLPLAVLLAFAVPATAATLRGGTSLSSPSVRLSDLWDGVDNDRAIGPGPEPGGRIIVEAAQLGAIARQFSVDWRPSSASERIVLERPGRAFPREDALAALHTALTVAGISPDADVEMPGFTAPLIPAESTGKAEVGQLDYNPVGGNFTALLSITAAGMSPAHVRLSGRIVEMVELPVAVRHMMPGDIIGAADVQMARLRATLVRADVAQLPAQAIGMALRHPVGAGAPLLLADLAHPQLVEKGELVQMRLDTPGITVVAQGVAMDAGAAGEHVRVLNTSSRAIVDAEVVAAGRVRVSGTTPVLLPPGAPVPVRVAAR